MAWQDATAPHDARRLRREAAAYTLAERLPDLMLQARRVAQTVAHGVHGRRRAGPGETFWQFRHYQDGDDATRIDWRRSASSDQLFVREREWEAAHTVWLWPDISASMDFRSHLSETLKSDRAVIFALALADLLIRGGERIGLLGRMTPTASRTALEKLALSIAEIETQPQADTSLPPAATISRFSEAILISDFLEPIGEIEARISALAAQGAHGHLIQIIDPAEETLPYAGRVEFLGMEDGTRLLADRVDTMRQAYQQRFQAHRAALQLLADRFEWTLAVHHTDRPAEETLLAVHARLSGALGDYRHTGPVGPIGSGGTGSNSGGRSK